MNKLSRNLLFGAMLAALPMGSALACTTSAWTGGNTGSAVAGDPAGGDADGAVPRYSGTCGLQPAAGGTSFVTDNSPAGESIYRARFYVFTGAPGATTTIFRATDSDNNVGNQRVAIAYNPAGSFDFAVNGTTVPSVSSIQADRWYSIEINFQDGQPFTASVQGAQAASPTNVTSAGNASGTIGSASLGAIGAAATANNLRFDEFESTRSASTAIGRLTVGDANADASCNANDLSETAGEVRAGLLGTEDYAVGQPDCTENGAVDANDLSCIANIVIGDLINGTTCGA